MLPNLDEFLEKKRISNSYIKHPDFSDLYVRKNPIYIQIDGKFCYCENVLTIARIIAKKKGQGAFSRLLADLKQRGLAVHVECVQNLRFAKHLARIGFQRVNEHHEGAPSFIWNHDGHLSEKIVDFS